MLDIKGIIPALVSPSDAEGKLDLKPVPGIMQFTMERGINGIFVGGSTGEGFRLTTDERKVLAEMVVREAAGRIPVIIHVASMNMREVICLSNHAAGIGADAVSSVLPFYYKYNLDDIHRYYQTISRESGLPIIIYALSQVVRLDFDNNAFMDKVLSIDGIYGIKFTDGDLFRLQSLQQLSGGKIRFFGGVDVLALPMLIMGASGLIGSNYNYLPEIWVSIYKAFLNNEMDKAVRLQDRLTYYVRKYSHLDGIVRTKSFMKVRGIDAGPAFLPHQSIKSGDEIVLRNIFKEMTEDPALKHIIQ